jgi:hypothetical protein
MKNKIKLSVQDVLSYRGKYVMVRVRTKYRSGKIVGVNVFDELVLGMNPGVLHAPPQEVTLILRPLKSMTTSEYKTFSKLDKKWSTADWKTHWYEREAKNCALEAKKVDWLRKKGFCLNNDWFEAGIAITSSDANKKIIVG